MNTTRSENYYARLRRVLTYIDTHLDEDLCIEKLSGVAAFSRFHFQRQFSELFGIGVYEYVQLARFKRASYRLAFRDDAVTTIALESGYESPEAFSRAFRKRIGQSPRDFRKSPALQDWQSVYEPIKEIRMKHMNKTLNLQDVNIIDFSETKLAALEHRGDPALIGESIRTFIGWRKEAGLPLKMARVFNIIYDDPDKTPPEEFRLDICATTEKDILPNEAGVIAKTIPAGRCAVLRHAGGDDGFGKAIYYLYGEWLPQSGEELRDFPLFCQRVSFFPDVAEHEAITDIFLPLKG